MIRYHNTNREIHRFESDTQDLRLRGNSELLTVRDR